MTNRVGKWLKQLLSSLELPAPEVAHRLARIQAIERNLVLPLKVVAIAMILFSLHESPWFGMQLGSFDITIDAVNTLFAAYVAVNLAVAALFVFLQRLPFALIQWSVFALSLIDGIFVGALTLVSGGYESPLFWLFVLLILRNVAANPPVWSQLVLNLGMAVCFAVASLLAVGLNKQVDSELGGHPGYKRGLRPDGPTNAAPRIIPAPDPETPAFTTLEAEGVTEAIVIRVIVLMLGGVWLFGVQVLLEKQKLTDEELREFAMRENQLRSAGRLAAEFAHQIKNPLAIVNNAAFSLARGLRTGKGDPHQHVRIIQEEVTRADRIITQVMGYAELTEGRVEKLDLPTKIELAVREVFPPGLAAGIKVKLDLHGPFPPLLMQRRHISEILVNLLLNAREALGDKGKITLSARVRPDRAVEIIVSDNGPGIPADKLERIFEAYFTTKERGTGLGLSIVKNNVELYGGTARAESELGKGARFTLVFPARASMKPVISR